MDQDPLTASFEGDELPDVTESMRLVVRAQAGDREALDDLITRYEDRLKRIVRIRLSARLRRCVETVDIVQETWRAAANAIGDFELRGTASILQWLSRIAENQMLDTHRRNYGLKRDRSREVRLGGDRRGDDDDAVGVTPADAGLRPDQIAQLREARRLVDDAVSRLPDDYREVVMLRTYYGGSWEFVAQQMGRESAEAARQLHRRARIRLARELGDVMPDDV